MSIQNFKTFSIFPLILDELCQTVARYEIPETGKNPETGEILGNGEILETGEIPQTREIPKNGEIPVSPSSINIEVNELTGYLH